MHCDITTQMTQNTQFVPVCYIIPDTFVTISKNMTSFSHTKPGKIPTRNKWATEAVKDITERCFLLENNVSITIRKCIHLHPKL